VGKECVPNLKNSTGTPLIEALEGTACVSERLAQPDASNGGGCPARDVQ